MLQGRRSLGWPLRMDSASFCTVAQLQQLPIARRGPTETGFPVRTFPLQRINPTPHAFPLMMSFSCYLHEGKIILTYIYLRAICSSTKPSGFSPSVRMRSRNPVPGMFHTTGLGRNRVQRYEPSLKNLCRSNI